MASIDDAGLNKVAAWPVDVISDSSNTICGFAMRKLDGFVPLHMLFSPMDRKRLFPDKGYNFLVHVARNLASAFLNIHQLGIVVGDVNEGNILVNKQGMVTLIDCDSFQIKNGNHYHFCEVGITRYTPPEILEKGTFDNVIRTINTDSFSLAILIFQLLFLGRHPFTGVNLTAEDIDEEKAIKTREFAYSLTRQTKKLTPPRNSFELKSLNPGLIDLFHHTFERIETRPEPQLWMQELDVLSKEMIVCTHYKLHSYPRTLGQCPWCRFKDLAGVVYFLDDLYLKTVPELMNIEQFVNGFKLEQLEIRKLPETFVSPNMRAVVIDPKFRALKNLNNLVIGISIGVTICICILFEWYYIATGLIFIGLFNRFSPTKKQLRTELAARKIYFDALTIKFRAVVKQHNNPPEMNKYNQSVKKLTGLIVSFRQLPLEFTNKKKRIEENHYHIHYHTFLQQFEVKDFAIPNFGPAKKLLIAKNGIKTAADVSNLPTMKINGIGPKNQQVLLNWQRHMGGGFTYSPNIEAINRDISHAATEVGVARHLLERDIKDEFKMMSDIRASIITTINGIEQKYQQMGAKVYQAELDYKAFKRLF